MTTTHDHPTRRTAIIGALLLPLLPRRAAAQAVSGERSQREIALRIARELIIPRYRALAAETGSQAEAWRSFRARPEAGALASLKRAYGAAADAWSGIEAVRSGPIAEDSRYERIAHWPERRNAVSRALTSLLAGDEPFAPERLRRASVAGQGLTALERLLYGEAEGGTDAAARAIAAPDKAGARRRDLGLAIAEGVDRIASEVLAAWTGPELARWEAPGPDEAREALTRLATDHLAMLEVIQDAKINAVIGRDSDEARPLLAEGWRSGRSLRAISIGLEEQEAFARAALAHDPDQLQSVVAGLATARSLAGELAAKPASIGAVAADASGRMRLVLLRDAVASAREVAGPALSESLDITIGFNSQDGD
ncbi:imelysin family protein [Enterovirga aerilata]|uniref:Imelysin family protein n=1 Tax=Enterovirga aerilata TaxID=2730920 RepID=A0A849I203_9HYPH|nr:imelysin family protein [Enterovirga sp. DB1703]NNM73402.1 imelysin family protein [Enterovirga sp. DB1703]